MHDDQTSQIDGQLVRHRILAAGIVDRDDRNADSPADQQILLSRSQERILINDFSIIVMESESKAAGRWMTTKARNCFCSHCFIFYMRVNTACIVHFIYFSTHSEHTLDPWRESDTPKYVLIFRVGQARTELAEEFGKQTSRTICRCEKGHLSCASCGRYGSHFLGSHLLGMDSKLQHWTSK